MSDSEEFSSDDELELDQDLSESDDDGGAESDGTESSHYTPAASDDEQDIEDADEQLELEQQDDMNDEQNTNLDWQDTRNEVDIDPFIADTGPNHNLNRNAREIDYFKLFFEENMIEKLVAETNLYAMQKGPDPKWKDTSRQEISAFIGMLIIMGINNVPDYKFYWSGNKFLCNQGFKDVMPVKRYEKLNQYFHANDNTIEIPVGEPGHDKLHKIRPFINSSMANFSDRYKPNKNQSVDEAMVAYRGRYGAKQYIPSKPIKWGFKVWMRCDSKSGYCHQYDIYMGKEHGVNYRNKGLGQRVVEKLTEPIRNKNHHISFDSYFTSIPLMRSLLNDGMYAYVTIRSNRKGFPEDLKKPPRMPTGQFIGRQTEDMVALVWMDSKVVSVVATNESLIEVDVTNRRQKNGTNLQISRPRAVTNYQEHFRGVDVCDQLRTKYAVGRPSKKWWKYLLHFIIDLCIIDAFIVMQEGPQVERARKRFRQIDFRVNLAMQLIGDFSCSNTRRAVNGPVIRASHVHVKLNRKRSSCKLCPKTGAKKRKTTQFGCERCNTHLCSVQCYTEFHRQAGIPVIIEE